MPNSGAPLSPDGNWFWDGARWNPVRPPRDHRRLDRWLSVGAIAVFLVLAVPVSLQAWSVGSGHSPTDLGALGRTLRGCDSSALQPNARVGAGGQFCGGLRLGSQLLAVDCSSKSGFDQALDVGTFDSSGNAGGNGTVAVSNGACVMTAPKGEAVAVAPLRVDPSDAVVVTDFTPPRGVNAVIGLDLRCSQNACLAITLGTGGQYDISEANGSSNPKQLAGSASAVSSIRPMRPNRLIASFKGSSLSVYMNGDHLFAGQISVPAAGTVIFFNHNVDQAQKNSVVKMGGIRIFAAG